MSAREEAHGLLDRLSDAELEIVARMLRGLAAPDSLDAFLASCPIDDEEETEEERTAVAEAREDVRQGRVVSHEELIQRRKARA